MFDNFDASHWADYNKIGYSNTKELDTEDTALRALALAFGVVAILVAIYFMGTAAAAALAGMLGPILSNPAFV